MLRNPKKIVDFLVEEILYNGYLQSLSGATVAYISSLVLFKKEVLSFFWLIFLIFLFIHIFDRFRDIRLDEKTNRKRVRHLLMYFDKIPLVLSFLFLMLLFFLLKSKTNLNAILFSLLIIFFGLLYPIFFKKITKIIPLFKNFYVSSVYFLVAFYPILNSAYNLSSLSLAFWIFSFFVLSESGISQMILDVKDLESDKLLGLKTLPVILGRAKALSLITKVSLIVDFFFLLICLVFQLPFLFLLLSLAGLFLNQLIVLNLRKDKELGFFLAPAKFFVIFLLIKFLIFFDIHLI